MADELPDPRPGESLGVQERYPKVIPPPKIEKVSVPTRKKGK